MADLKWYIVHVYSGFENRVKLSLEEKISVSPFKESFGEIIVPTETVVELVQGKKKGIFKKILSWIYFDKYAPYRCNLAFSKQFA